MNSDELSAVYVNARVCSVCFRDVQHIHPRSCDHVICQQCSSDFINSNPGRECRLCRRDSTGSANNSDLTPPTSPRRSSPFCASCRNRKSTSAYCEDCNGDICSDCKDQHANLSALRNHRLVFKMPVVPDSPTSPPIYCRQHPREYANRVCHTCDRVRVCNECVRETHVNHYIQDSISADGPTVTSAPNAPLVSQGTYMDLVRKLDNLQLNVQERIKALSASMTETEKEIQTNADNYVRSAVEEAEKTKRDIDRQVSEYTERISSQKEKLLNQLLRRENFIQQKSQMINFNLQRARDSEKGLRTKFNRHLRDPQGYIQMVDCEDLIKLNELRGMVDSLQKNISELTFDFVVSGGRDSLGTILPFRRWIRITNSCVQRLKDMDYVPSAMLSAPNDTILFTSCKGSTKAALDLVDINGNAIHTRKLQDSGEEAAPVPAFGAMIDDDIAVMGWEKTVFTLKISTLDQVSSSSIKRLLVPNAKICCLVSDQNLQRVAIGNDKNRILNLFDLDLNPTSSVTIKEKGSPPSSLAFQGEHILFTDGERAALAVDQNGNTVAQFLPPTSSSLKPVAVEVLQELVYILWVNDSCAVVQCYTMESPEILGNPIGEPLTNLPKSTKFIAVASIKDGNHRVITGTPDGRITVYCKQDYLGLQGEDHHYK